MRIKGQRPVSSRKRKPKKRKAPGSANPNLTYWGVKHASKSFDELTPEERVECWFHFPSFCHFFLKVWTKPDANNERRLVPLDWNYAQREFWPKRGHRNWHLKSRQVGWTTIELAEDFWIAATRRGSNVQVLTHSAELTGEMRLRISTFIEHLPERFAIKLSKDNRDGFGFDSVPGIGSELRSHIGLQTVSGKHKGIGKTISKLHMTEVARWDNVTGGVGHYIATAIQALPKVVPVTIETTPNGLGHPSYQLWQQAEKGESGFEPIFMPWWYDETAVAKVDGDFAIKDEKESWLVKQGATPEHIAFRRMSIREMASRQYSGEAMFNQEYPSDPRTCFIAGGRSAFPADRLVEQEENIDKEAAYEREDGRPFSRMGRIYIGPNSGKPLFAERLDGPLTIWELPARGAHYVIGADIGKGLPTGDFSTACVLRTSPLEQVGEYHARTPPREFAYHLNALGRMYNDALLAPEKNGEGYLVVSELYETLMYPNLYTAKKTQKGYAEDTHSYGWHNNGTERAIAISEAADLIWQRSVKIRSKALIEELLSFIEDENGKYQAPKGGFDDLAMAFIITCWAMANSAFTVGAPWVDGETPWDVEQVKHAVSRQYAGENIWEEPLDSAVEIFLR